MLNCLMVADLALFDEVSRAALKDGCGAAASVAPAAPPGNSATPATTAEKWSLSLPPGSGGGGSSTQPPNPAPLSPAVLLPADLSNSGESPARGAYSPPAAAPTSRTHSSGGGGGGGGGEATPLAGSRNPPNPNPNPPRVSSGPTHQQQFGIWACIVFFFVHCESRPTHSPHMSHPILPIYQWICFL